MPQTSSELPDFFARHRALLEQAVTATATRDHWTPYPESPSKSVYGEDAAKIGEAAFEERLDGRFELGISYPRVAPDEAVAAALAATGPWRDAGPDNRAGVAAEILARLNAASLEIAPAVRHTTGQAFVMAFQAGGPHATLSDPAFVTGRLATLRSRRPAPAEETPDA